MFSISWDSGFVSCWTQKSVLHDVLRLSHSCHKVTIQARSIPHSTKSISSSSKRYDYHGMIQLKEIQ